MAFGKGKINIALQRTGYVPGDTISRNVVMTLKKPVKARGVGIFLIGERTAARATLTTRGTTINVTRIHDSKQELDSEKEYGLRHEYQFEMKIPFETT